MMTFGQDQVVVSPLKDLYDTNIMQMAIAAAKDMYDKNYADMKEFAKTYGDFVSPIGNYTQQYYDMSKGLVNKKIDELYARGIDPLRSAQGRAEIQKIINSVDVGRLNQMKAETEAAKEYVKNRARMQAENRYNPEFEKWMLGGRTLETWDGSQPWTATSPYLYQDLNEYTGHIFDKMQDEYISSDGQYDYTGVSEDRRRAALTPQLAGIISTPLGQYHLELAKQDAAIKYGRVPTDAEVMQQFQDNIITSTKEYERRNRTENKDYARRRDSALRMAEDDHRTANDIRAHAANAATDYHYDVLGRMDYDGDGKVSKSERALYAKSGGSKKNKEEYSIFREAEQKGTTSVEYDPEKTTSTKIAAIDSRITFYPPEKKGQGGAYIIPKDVASRVLYSHNSVYKNGHPRRIKGWENIDNFGQDSEGKPITSVQFIPTGHIHARRYKDGSIHYFITGTITGRGDSPYEMEVQENWHDYGKK